MVCAEERQHDEEHDEEVEDRRVVVELLAEQHRNVSRRQLDAERATGHPREVQRVAVVPQRDPDVRRFQVIRESDGVTLLRAGMRFACIELSSGRPRRMPPAFIEGYGPAVLGGHTSQPG